MYLSYSWLCDMMQSRARVAITKDGKIYRGLINGVFPESGSGKDWMVMLNDNGSTIQLYIRTA